MKNKLFKRISAAFVAMCIAVSLIPAVFAEGTEKTAGEKTYTFCANSDVAAGNYAGDVDEFGTWGWKFLAVDKETESIYKDKKLAYSDKSTGGYNYRVLNMQSDHIRLETARTAGSGAANAAYTLPEIRVAFALEAPAAGFYKAESKGMTMSGYFAQLYLGKNTNSTDINVYTASANAFSKTIKYVNIPSSITEETWKLMTRVPLDGIIYSDGTTELAFAINTGEKKKYIRELSLVPINPTISLVVDETTLTVGEETKATVYATWTEDGATTPTEQRMLNSFVDYDLSDNPTIDIDELGNIKATAVGPTTITVTYGEDTYEATVNVKAPVIVPEVETVETTTVSFKAGAYTGGTVSNSDVQNVEIGTDVMVTATPNTGYTFAYWKNAAGVVLSTSATETFKVNTNMGVIAVFDAVATDAAIPVQFYNGNGLPLGNTSVAKNTTFGVAKSAAGITTAPSLTGYVFSHWSDKDENVAIEDNALITALTRAVAIYEDDEDTTFTVKNGTAIVAEGKKYGEDVTVTSTANDFSYWKLGNKIMSYDKSFTFKVYGDITLTEVTGESVAAAPTLILDVVGGNYFLTYDEGEYELIEAGILFAKTGTPKIDGYNSKAIAVKGTGQFTAQPSTDNEPIARGYMICKSGDDYKVIYAD